MNVFRTLLLVTLTAITLYEKNTMAADRPDADLDIMEGAKLSADEAQQLEETLKHKPEDLSIRAKLLGYYSARPQRSEWFDGIRKREVLWIIEHHPEARIAGLPEAQFHLVMDASDYQKAPRFGSSKFPNTAMTRTSCAMRPTTSCCTIPYLPKAC